MGKVWEGKGKEKVRVHATCSLLRNIPTTANSVWMEELEYKRWYDYLEACAVPWKSWNTPPNLIKIQCLCFSTKHTILITLSSNLSSSICWKSGCNVTNSINSSLQNYISFTWTFCDFRFLSLFAIPTSLPSLILQHFC